MRLLIGVQAALVAALDHEIGRWPRITFIVNTLTRAFEKERRWRDVEAALGGIEDGTHDWDADPQAWVRLQRDTNASRVG